MRILKVLLLGGILNLFQAEALQLQTNLQEHMNEMPELEHQADHDLNTDDHDYYRRRAVTRIPVGRRVTRRVGRPVGGRVITRRVTRRTVHPRGRIVRRYYRL